MRVKVFHINSKYWGLTLGILLLLVVITGWLMNQRVDPSTWPEPPPRPADAEPGLTIMFLGVSHLLLQDEEHSLLIDGFCSRPSAATVLFSRLGSEPEKLATCLAHIQQPLAGLVVTHGHYDHALDAAAIVAQYGGALIGSNTIRQLGLGAGLSDAQILTPRPRRAIQLGSFRVSLIEGQHSPALLPILEDYDQELTSPMSLPQRAMAFKPGPIFAVHIAHRDCQLLVSSSDAVVPDIFANYQADGVFLGIASLGRRSESFIQEYLKENVTIPGANWVVPVHWDDFTRPLPKLTPFPTWLTRTDRAIASLSKTFPSKMRRLLAFESIDCEGRVAFRPGNDSN